MQMTKLKQTPKKAHFQAILQIIADDYVSFSWLQI